MDEYSKSRGAKYVVKPPDGYTWQWGDAPPTHVRESSAGEYVPPCSPSPRGLPGEKPLPVGLGYCVTESTPPAATEPLQEAARIDLSGQTLHYLREECRWLKAQEAEHAIAFSVNQEGDIVGVQRISDGAPRECTVEVDQVVKEAMGHDGSCAVILLHNHPGAVTPEPSPADQQLTTALQERLQAKGLNLQDHVIVSRMGRIFSFHEAETEVEVPA